MMYIISNNDRGTCVPWGGGSVFQRDGSSRGMSVPGDGSSRGMSVPGDGSSRGGTG